MSKYYVKRFDTKKEAEAAAKAVWNIVRNDNFGVKVANAVSAGYGSGFIAYSRSRITGWKLVNMKKIYR